MDISNLHQAFYKPTLLIKAMQLEYFTGLIVFFYDEIFNLKIISSGFISLLFSFGMNFLYKGNEINTMKWLGVLALVYFVRLF